MNRSVAINALLKALFTAKVSKNLEMGAEIIKLGIESHKPLDIVINFKTPYLEDALRIFFKDNYLTTTLNGKQLLHLYVIRYINLEDGTVTLKQLLSDMDQDGFFKRYPANKRALLQLLKAENIDIDDSGNIYLATFDIESGAFTDIDVSSLWEHIFKISFILAQLFGMIYFETLYIQVEDSRLLEQEPFEGLDVVTHYIDQSNNSISDETDEIESIEGIEGMSVEKQLHLLLLSFSKGQLDEIATYLNITYTTYNRSELIAILLQEQERLTDALALLGYFDDYHDGFIKPFTTFEAYLKIHGSLKLLIDEAVLKEALEEDDLVYVDHLTEIPKELEDQLSELIKESTIDDITSIVTADIIPSLQENVPSEVPVKDMEISDDECLSYLDKLLNTDSQDDTAMALKQEILSTIRASLETEHTK